MTQDEMYDARTAVNEPIKVPFKAAWTIVSIKNASWRSWTLALTPPHQEGQVEEYVLFAPAKSDEAKLQLVATCIQCGTKASHVCGGRENAGFCEEHGEHEHRDNCN